MSTIKLPMDRALSKFFAKSESVDRLCRKLLFRILEKIEGGYLTLTDSSGLHVFGDSSAPLKAHITVHKFSFYSRSVLGGSIGNAESYIDGEWDVDHITSLIRIFVLNRNLVQSLDGGLGKVLAPIQKGMHGLRANTIKGSRNNISAHYDIGNDFFRLFLDKTMMYSSAIFSDEANTLELASINKIKTICDKLCLKETDRLIEIGTGWGSLAIYAAKNYGCHVTTTTISVEQHKHTLARIKEEGLEDKITVLFEDYRKLTGQYDKLVSVEMIEAVGLDNLPIYFEKCSSLLKPTGLMALQAITIRDQFYENAKNSVDFIQRHIFPGGGLPSIQAMMNCIGHQTDLMLLEQRDYSDHYADTLKCWEDKLSSNHEEITKLGYPDYLYRLWRFYFAYCEGGFRERAIGLSQLVFGKPLYREGN